MLADFTLFFKGVWNQGAKILIKKARHMKGLVTSPPGLAMNPGARGMPSAVAFVDHCVDVLFRGLRSLSTYTQVAGEDLSDNLR